MSFTASATPVVVGSAVAYHEGRFDPLLFAIALAASIAIHAGANLTNDYFDHLRGADTPDSPGPSGVIQQGLLAPQAVRAGALFAFAVGGLLGLGLVAARGWPILLIGVLSVLAAYTYTGGPVPLGYVGLGDLVVFVFMGLVTVAGAYYVQTGSVSVMAFWAALPPAALVDAILVANNLRDLEADRTRGKRTLATFIGRRATRWHYAAMLIAAYGCAVIGVAVRALPPTVLVILVTVPGALRIWRIVRVETELGSLTRGALRGTARLHLDVGVLITAALIVSR